MTRQVAILVALAAVAAAAALISFGSWILLRRGRPDSEENGQRAATTGDET